jgi:hypothetical protein
MSFRFAFALTLGSLSCSGSVQAHGPQLDLAASRDGFVVQVQSRPTSHLPGNIDTGDFQLRPDPPAR